MTFRRDWLADYTPFKEKPFWVEVGNGQLIPVEGQGNVCVQVALPTGLRVTHTIENILYVPLIEKNLLSVAKCSKKGLKIFFEEGNNGVRLLKKGKIVAIGIPENNMYRLYFETIVKDNDGVCESNVATAESLISYERLGHPNFKTLRMMQELSCQ